MKTGNEVAGRAIVPIAEVLLRQIRAVGQLGLDAPSITAASDALLRRCATAGNIFQVLEHIAGLVCEDGVPFVYNLQRWPEGLPPAGYTGGDVVLQPSTLLETYVLAWHAATIESPVSGRRFLKAALWVCLQKGLAAALRYTLDLERYGFVRRPVDVHRVLSALISAQRIVAVDKDIVPFFLGRAPATPRELMDADFVAFDLETPPTRPIAPAAVEALVSAALQQVERVRNATNYDEWLTGHWVLSSHAEHVLPIINQHVTKLSAGLNAILDQLEEMRADGGGITGIITVQSTTRQLDSALPALVNVIRVGIEHAAGSDWKRRALEERGIPRGVADKLFDRETLDDPAWRMVSGHLAPIYLEVVLHRDPRDLIRSRPFTTEEILANDAAGECFMAAGIDEPRQRLAAARHLSGDWSAAGFQRFKSWLPRSPGEHPPVAVDDGFDADYEQFDKWFEDNKKFFENLHENVTRAMAIDEIERRLQPVIDGTCAVEKRAREVAAVLELYPWLEVAIYEAGIVADDGGDHERGLELFSAAIHANPANPMYWQSLGVALNRSGHSEEAQIAAVISKMLAGEL
jgi:hypothetical protein